MRCVLTFVWATLGTLAVAQTNLTDVLGAPPDVTTYPIPGVGFVNLNNGNLHIQMPLRSVKDRNGVPVTTSITYDNSIFQIIQVPSTNGQTTVSAWNAYPLQYPAADAWESGFRNSISPNYSGYMNWTSTTVRCGTGGEGQQNANWQFVDSNGTNHPFPSGLMTGDSALSPCGYHSGFQASATDGSGYWLEVANGTSAIVYDLHGNIVGSGGKDTNGNIATANYDKLGRSIALPSDFTTAGETINVWTNFNDSATEIGPLSAPVASSITLPDGRKYAFQYDDAGPPGGTNGQYLASQQGHYGSLTGITLPTGGQITITSEVLPVAFSSFPSAFVVKSITTPDGTWNFSYSSTSGLITATAPTDPVTGLASQTTCCGNTGGAQTLKVYAGTAAGTLLRTVTKQYSAQDRSAR